MANRGFNRRRDWAARSGSRCPGPTFDPQPETGSRAMSIEPASVGHPLEEIRVAGEVDASRAGDEEPEGGRRPEHDPALRRARQGSRRIVTSPMRTSSPTSTSRTSVKRSHEPAGASGHDEDHVSFEQPQRRQVEMVEVEV